jgi:hypothetical protein
MGTILTIFLGDNFDMATRLILKADFLCRWGISEGGTAPSFPIIGLLNRYNQKNRQSFAIFPKFPKKRER